MKKHSLIAVALATASFLAFNVPAQAVPISPAQAAAGFSVSAPENGTITYTGLSSGPVTNSVLVTVPQDTEITLNYALSGATFTSLTDSYDGGLGYAQSFFVPGVPGLEPENTSIGTSLAFVSANLTSPNSGTITIANTSGGSILFTNLLSAFFGSGASEKITFNVSSVPLPATLSMFGAVMLGLFGFGWMKRKQSDSPDCLTL